MRFTAKVLEEVLRLNEGFTWKTSYSGKNFSETRRYLIEGGKLIVQAVGKTSWADSRFNKTWVADGPETRRLLHTVLARLRTK